MNFMRTVLSITFSLLSLIISAQPYDGELQFVGRNFLNNKPLNNTQVKIISGNTLVSEFNTKSHNDFKATLPYGNIYDIYLMNAASQKMFVRVYADGIPENKRHYRITYALDIPFFTKDQNLDTSQFTKQFHQIVFDGKSKFIDDTVYMNNFIRHIYRKETSEKKDTTLPFITTQKLKEFVQLAGKLSLDNDKQSPLKNKTIRLVNKNGEIISTSQTTNHGMFVFQGVDAEEANGLAITLAENDNPNNDKIKIQNASLEKLDVATGSNQSFAFTNKDGSNLISKLIDKDFKYHISGKLVATNGTEKKVASQKTVYLLGDKNNVLHKTKTNALGNFLFSGIVPGQSYAIAYDSADAETNFIMNLYSVKDKFIKRLDSVSSKKFIYKFLSVSSTSFNDLVMDDTDLKMNVKGRLYGDNKNNPLGNMKVLLLNDHFEKIDSALTDPNGDFSFKHLPYTKQILLTAENEKNILESFTNVLLFDNDDNLIKLVSLVKGHRFNYKPLPTEQNRFSEIYMDDPWLSIINKEMNSKNKPDETATIIENILFEFNKADLASQSQQTLDKVVLALKSNKKMRIDLSAHSDSKGSDSYNLKLSEQRANSAKNYIISKGIEAIRVSAKGYGESKLLNNCGNNVPCSEDEHAMNRRLEFKLMFD